MIENVACYTKSSSWTVTLKINPFIPEFRKWIILSLNLDIFIDANRAFSLRSKTEDPDETSCLLVCIIWIYTVCKGIWFGLTFLKDLTINRLGFMKRKKKKKKKKHNLWTTYNKTTMV